MTMPTPPPSGKTRQKSRPPVQRRQRAAELRAAAQRAERRKRLVTVGVAALLVLLVGAGIAVQAARSTSGGSDAAPSGTTADGFGVRLGAPDAPVLVEIWEDFMCPACGRFEQAAGDDLREMAAEGRIRVVYRGMSFLDDASTTRYSTRALNAAGCAVDQGRFVEFHEGLFAAQPPEGGPGLSDDRLVAIGERAGIDGEDFASCVEDLTYERWVERSTDAASKAGVVQTPTVRVDGQDLAEPTLEALLAAVTAAA
jgi:protein-disulfide isomerase